MALHLATGRDPSLRHVRRESMPWFTEFTRPPLYPLFISSDSPYDFFAEENGHKRASSGLRILGAQGLVRRSLGFLPRFGLATFNASRIPETVTTE